MIYTKEPDRWYMHPVAPMFTQDLKHIKDYHDRVHAHSEVWAWVVVGLCVCFGAWALVRWWV